jgi:beta-N-acetylhexosaminidase
VGGVILTGRSKAGIAATAALTARVRAAVPGRAVLIATDQEGGAVQVLKGPGFSPMPSALSQGGLSPVELRARARTWGGQLRAAGVRVDLAPVADTVPAGAANPPIGAFGRQYGSDPATVATHAAAFAAGLADAGVVPTVKHFPGLGRVSANTDVSSGVTDRVTTRSDPYLDPFRAVIRIGHPFVMVSSAVYSRIDAARPAVFSPSVITGLLRGDLGFDGVVFSDDLGAARQVSAVPVGERAVRFIAAGGDVVLTVSPRTLPAMFAALYDRAVRDPAFRAQVDRSAQRILLAKQRLGLVARNG